MRNQAPKRPPDAGDVGATDLCLHRHIQLPVGPPPAPPVRGGIEVVHEPGVRSHRSPDPQGVVLTADERLEVIVDDRLGEGREKGQRSSLKEEGVPAEALGHPSDARLGTVERAGDLAVSGAGDEAGGSPQEELGALQVVGGGEGLAGAGALAGKAVEARDANAARALLVVPVTLEALPARAMGGAFGPGTEGGKEAGRTHRFDGMVRPAHGPVGSKRKAGGLRARRLAFSVRRPSARTPPDALPPHGANNLAATLQRAFDLPYARNAMPLTTLRTPVRTRLGRGALALWCALALTPGEDLLFAQATP